MNLLLFEWAPNATGSGPPKAAFVVQPKLNAWSNPEFSKPPNWFICGGEVRGGWVELKISRTHRAFSSTCAKKLSQWVLKGWDLWPARGPEVRDNLGALPLPHKFTLLSSFNRPPHPHMPYGAKNSAALPAVDTLAHIWVALYSSRIVLVHS